MGPCPPKGDGAIRPWAGWAAPWPLSAGAGPPTPSIPVPMAQPHQVCGDLAGARCRLKLVCEAHPFAWARCQIRDWLGSMGPGAAGSDALALAGELDLTWWAPWPGIPLAKVAPEPVPPVPGRMEVVQGAHRGMRVDQHCPAHAAGVLQALRWSEPPLPTSDTVGMPGCPGCALPPTPSPASLAFGGTLAGRSRSMCCSPQGCRCPCQPRCPFPHVPAGDV